jgi:uncharacterized protein YecT (DUF1311 family)
VVKALSLTVVAVLLATTLPASAENWADNRDPITMGPEYARSKAICRSIKGVSFSSPVTVPGGDAALSLKGCSSEALYYGIGVPPDPARARQCALRERTAPDTRAALSGDAMLMTIYANGVGAPRDLDRAIAIACNLDGAPAEEDGRVNHLASLKAQHWAGHDFSFCDDVTSGYAQGICAAHAAAIEDAERKRRLAAVTAGWSDADKRAFAALQRAEAAYVTALSGNEVDMSGTARAAMVTDEEQGREAEFLDTLQKLEKGTVPVSTTERADAADARLNAAYQRIQHTTDTAAWGTVTKDGIRTAQRAWLRYRDAWIAFAQARHSAVTPESLRAALTEQRATALEAFLQ